MEGETKGKQHPWLGKLFILAILAILTAGLLRTVFWPKEINGYENRYANQMPSFTLSGFLDGTFQDGVDSALMDQVQLAQAMKQTYNQTKSCYLAGAVESITQLAGLDPYRYVSFQGLCLYGDGYIVNWTRPLSMDQEALDRKADALNSTFANHPELTFYTYYIEKDTDLDFETGTKTGLADYLMPQLNLPEENKGIYRVDSFAEFAEKFYRTDTHWNYLGSYEGYLQLHDLLGCAGDPLQPAGEAVEVSDTFSGVKASTVGADGVFTETFFAWPYEFPAMTVTINGQPAEDYGSQDIYLSGQATDVLTYGSFYGGDNGETVFSTGTEGRGNLLVIGESFDNAILKLLASHFDRLYSIDLRYYEAYMGTAFSLSDYLEQHQPDRVLLIGNADYFASQDFLLED